MQLRPVHLAVAALTALAALTAVSPATAAVKPVAEQPVSRFVAFQACQAATWKWTAINAKAGTSVAAFRHQYRPQDVWREHGSWHVQVAGKRGQAVAMDNDVAYCIIGGTNAHPKLTGGSYPR